jgi:dienelactone hydrolase
MRRLLLAALLLPLGAAPAAAGEALAARLSAPWPAIEGTSYHDGEMVTFPSSSPFTPFDAIRKPGEPPTTASGVLAFPKDLPARTRVPAVVILHGGNGILWSREVTYARQLAELGIAALIVDTFGVRRDRATAFDDRIIEITESMFVADAYAALRFLAARPEIDPARVALVGFSYGGMASMLAAYRQVADTFAPNGPRFAGHVGYYGPCIARFQDSRTTGAPILLMWGSEDALVDPKRCAEIVADLKGGGSPVETIVYQGAYHQWDGDSEVPRRMRRNLVGCSFLVEPDGGVRDTISTLPMTGTFGRKLILAACTSGDGYLIGRDLAVRQRSTADLGRFLAGVLAPTAAPPAPETVPAQPKADAAPRAGEGN